MKNIAFILLFITPFSVAGTYERATEVRMTCESIGKLSVSGFLSKEKSTPAEVADDAEAISKMKYQNSTDQALAKQAILFGFNDATSREQAYRKSWARCMDSYDF